MGKGNRRSRRGRATQPQAAAEPPPLAASTGPVDEANPTAPSKHAPGSPHDAPRWTLLHLWEIQFIRDIALALVVALLLYVGYVLRAITVPLLLALLLAYLFEPVIQWLTGESDRKHTRRRVSRPFAALALIIAAAVLIIAPVTGALAVGAVQGIELTQSIGSNLRTVVRFIDAAGPREPLETVETFIETESLAAKSAYQTLPEGLWQTIALQANDRLEVDEELRDSLGTWARENAERLASITVGTGLRAARAAIITGQAIALFAFSAFLTAFFFFFISTRFGAVLEFWRAMIPEGHRDKTIDLVSKMDVVISAFIRGRLTIMVVQCGIFSIGFALVGVPAGLGVGLIVGVLALFPYVSVVGVPIAIILMLLEPPDGFRAAWWWIVFAPAAIYLIGQLIDEYILTPSIQGKATNMDAPTVLFAALAGGILAGFYGLLVAIPVAACLKIVIIEIVWPRLRAWIKGQVRDPLPVSASSRRIN